jgi:hypothetical protein
VQQRGTSEGGPLWSSGPHVHVASKADAAVGVECKAISMGVVACLEHEAATIGGHHVEHKAKRSTNVGVRNGSSSTNE